MKLAAPPDHHCHEDEEARDPDARVLVLAPVGRDSQVICQTLGAEGIACSSRGTIADLLDALPHGAGAVLLTEESIGPAAASDLLEVLRAQPSWSDLPVVLLLASDDGGAPGVSSYVTSLRLGANVTLLQRPLQALTLITAMQASLRARSRQHQVRDLLVRERVAREQAEASIRIKDEFLATVSHELRAPLGAILLWSQLLASGRLAEPERRNAVHAITVSAQAQSLLVEDLLDVSRMLMGKLRLDVQPSTLATIVEAAIDVVRPTAAAKDVRLEIDVAHDDRRVLVDPDRLQQVFWNLLSNAIKFTPAGGLVELRLESAAGHASITIRDSGIGIAPDLLLHVFEPFRQGHPEAAQRHGGLGLGLSIVQRLVELHGGSVGVTSDGAGRGATFVVRLPIARA
ncbi:MAG: HAMP domain-containing histidine kinase [Myxococcota bacterium]|nr:HAMP domain-containing histidine kinase [Myxococcota bacterium]